MTDGSPSLVMDLKSGTAAMWQVRHCHRVA